MHLARRFRFPWSLLAAVLVLAALPLPVHAQKNVQKDASGNLTESLATGNKTVTISSGGNLTAGSGATVNLTNATLAMPAQYAIPSLTGQSGKTLSNNGSALTWSSAGAGDVTGPASATDNAIARFDATTGKLLQNSTVTISDTGDVEISSGTLSLGRSYLGAGRLVIEGPLTNVDNADNVIVTTNATASVSGQYEMFGISSQITAQGVPSGVTNTGGFYAITGDAYSNGLSTFAGTLSRQTGLRGRAGFSPGGASAGANVATAVGVMGEIRNGDADATMTTAIALLAINEETAGTITDRYDLYAGSANAKNYFGGRVGIGTTSPDYDLDVVGDIRGDGLIADNLTLTGTISLEAATRLFNLGSAAGTSDAEINLGATRAGSGNAFLDLIGDTTYSDYGLRLIRGGGANASSTLSNRGTGSLTVEAVDAGEVRLATNGSTRLAVASGGSVTISGNATVGGTLGITGNTTAGPVFDATQYGIYGPRSASSGVSGQVRFRDDTAASRWIVGILGTPAATAWSLYDLVNAAEPLTVTSAAAGSSVITFGGTLRAGSVPTTLTDSAGKILSAALNTVAVAQGGTGATTLTGYVKGSGTSALTASGTIPAADVTGLPVLIGVACSDETTAITTGTAKVTFRAPYAFTLTAVRATLTTVSSSGTPTVDINEAGTSVLSTKLTIDANEKTSTTAATAAVISDSAIADDAEITIDIDTAGTGAAGLKVWLIGTR